jgi:C-methyltransferase C-terminal domain
LARSCSWHFRIAGFIEHRGIISGQSGFDYSANLTRCGRAAIESARLITSIAMFCDLESLVSFVEDVAGLLAGDGIWHFEQSHKPSMLRTNSYDTICHEHLEFYSFTIVKNLLEASGLRVVDVETNGINGGSFAVRACRSDAPFRSNSPVIEWMLRQEQDLRLDTPRPYREFEERVYVHRKNLVELIEALTGDGKKIIGYGASTKGNALLQFCGLTRSHIPFIAEVNEEKFGCFMPATNIPIISEVAARTMKPDYLFVLTWHFKHSILEREAEFLAQGGKGHLSAARDRDCMK